MNFEHLFSPLTIRGVEFRNRIFSSGHQTLLAEGALPSEAMAAYHEARARGGAGLIITEATAVHETAYFNAALPTGYVDACIPGFSAIAAAVHKHDCRIIGQLFHPGSEIPAKREDGSRPVPWGPSARHQERYLVTVRPLPLALIEDIIEGYADTAVRMIEAGFDGVEVLASHGYLPAQFLNSHANQRDDRYGGPLENRLRFLVEVHDRVRQKLGGDRLVGLRISADEKNPHGLAQGEVLDAMAALDRADRFDYFNVTLGSSDTVGGAVHIVPGMAVETGYVAPFAEAIKRKTSRPIMVVGRINQPQEGERILAAGQADMVGMTRAQICDPEMANKARSGRLEDVRACIACNQACIGHYELGAPISCIQHPETGRELQLGTRVPAAAARRVMVVGGGPGGMKAAAVAAERGHEVALYEKAQHLGGQALLAQMLPGREEFGGIVTNLAHEVAEAGVEVRTGVEVSAELVRTKAPEVVIIATGATPFMPDIEGREDAHVVDAWQVIKNEANCGACVVIADWRGDWIGLGLAEKLAREGCHVRLCSTANAPGVNVQYYTRDLWIGELSRLGVEFIPYARLYGADRESAYFQHTASDEPLECADTDTLVVSYGHQSEMGLSDALAGWEGEVHSIGDALSPRTAEEAILDGLKIGSLI